MGALGAAEYARQKGLAPSASRGAQAKEAAKC
jgi:hypothetical protein